MKPVLSLARKVARAETVAARRAQHDYEIVYSCLRGRLRELYGATLGDVRVLDFGCGYRYPMLVLLRGEVREIVGVDVEPVFRDGWKQALPPEGWMKRPGLAADSLVEHVQAARYYRHLERYSQITPRHESYEIVRYDGVRLPFPDNSFDIVMSNAVLQELPEPLEQYAEEIARVLKPGGRIDIEWHNFYSWSGHYLGDVESRRDPWGHLLRGRYYPTLNRVTPDRVKEAFAPWFGELELLRHDREYRLAGRDPGYQDEAAEWLTDELADRLADYPREWLLTRGYVLQARLPES